MKCLSPKYAQYVILATIVAGSVWSTPNRAHAQVASPNAYLCKPKGFAQVEFSDDTKEWSATADNVSNTPPRSSDLRTIFRRAKPGDKSIQSKEFKWGVFVADSKREIVMQVCQNDFTEEGIIVCNVIPGYSTFYFNRNNLRYQETSEGTYVEPDSLGDSYSSGASIEFGTCSPI